MDTKSLEFAKDQNKWPVWPRLPLKRRKEGESWPELGFILGSLKEDPKPEVYLGTIYEEITEMTETIGYKSIEDIFEDGWMVD